MKAPRNEREAYFALSKPVRYKPIGKNIEKTSTTKLLLVLVLVLIIAWSIK